MTLSVNPTSMSDADRYLIGLFMTSNPQKKRYKANKAYSFSLTNPDTGHKEKKQVKLTHEIIKRPCRPDGKHRESFRFEVMEKHLGMEDITMKTVGVLVPQTAEAGAYFKPKIGFCKKLVDIVADVAEDSEVFREYRNTPRYMGMKPPVKLHGNLLLFMRFIEGDTLAHILKNDQKRTVQMRHEERISLCIAVTEALRNQVHNNGLIHRDILERNILINKEKKKVTFIDFNASIPLSEGAYPEQDNYRLAALFVSIFGGKNDVLFDTENDLKNDSIEVEAILNKLARTMPDRDRVPISLLNRMLSSSPHNGPSTTEIIQELRRR